jgi:hypothetical protein
MNCDRQYAFFLEQSECSRNALIHAEEICNGHLLALNANMYFTEKMMCGLVLWACGGDPREHMCLAIKALEQSAQTLKKLTPGVRVSQELPVEKANLIAHLIDRPTELQISLADFDPGDRRLDCLLAMALSNQADLGLFSNEIDVFAKSKKHTLAAKSYETYLAILDAETSDNSMQSLVNAAEILYKQRARDEFFSGGDPTGGGGPDNEFLLDFRLAAVLKKTRFSGESIHRWVW